MALVRSTPDWAVQVEPWPGTLCCVHGHVTLTIQMGTGEFNAGGSPAMD